MGIVTILAFVYIPLNLATSIFGMNIQQLNRTGQDLWIFIVTGAVALLITGVSWFCVEVLTSYKSWAKIGSTDNSRRNQALVFRLALLLWLVRNGYTTWMRRSGAWWCILSNDKFGHFRARTWYYLDTNPFITDKAMDPPEKACDYVYRSIQSGNHLQDFDLRTIT